MLIDIDDLINLDKRLNLFSVNKFNIFSFYEKDHGMKNGTPVKDWISKIISKSDIDIKTDNLKIYCLCYPRILGYVFNPITKLSKTALHNLKRKHNLVSKFNKLYKPIRSKIFRFF